MPFPEPDVDPYDNASRATNPIRGCNASTPTFGELHHIAAHDAEEFTDAVAVEDAGPSIPAWSAQLRRARTNAESHVFAQVVRSDGSAALGELHLFMETAAERCDQDQQPMAARHYRRQAARLAELGSHLGHLG